MKKILLASLLFFSISSELESEVRKFRRGDGRRTPFVSEDGYHHYGSMIDKTIRPRLGITYDPVLRKHSFTKYYRNRNRNIRNHYNPWR